MRIRTAAPLLLLASAAFGAYTYYYTDALTSINTANWGQNGTLTATPGGLLSYDANGGSLISKIAVPGGSSFYEVRTVISLAGSGGTYVTYLDASPDALSGATTSTGTYYAWEIQNPTFNGSACTAQLVGYKRVSGVVTMLSSSGVPCHSMMEVRIVRTSYNQLCVYIDGIAWAAMNESSITSGKPGVGVRGQTSAQGSIYQVSLGQIDTTPPNAVNAQSVGTSPFPNRVDLQWQGVVDDANGSGLLYYVVYRNQTYVGHTRDAEFTDETVSASTTYTYTIVPTDFHQNAVTTNLTVSTPPAGAIDPRRAGVRTTGSYWGAVGEQIDTLSGNLNFSAPLFKAMGRGGWGVGFALSYNSQLWRKDPGGTWKLGRDVGYGFGWRLQAGSLTPYYSGYYTLDHYLFVDSSGAEYRLDQNNAGVWTSSQGIYLSYDSNANRLYFPDGSFWVMGTISAGTEQDAGSQYPSLMEDTNGNEILIRYNAGLGIPWINSSARIGEIEDVRAVFNSGTGTYQSYTFTYNTDTIPHLTQVNNMLQNASESYTLGYLENQALSSPFTPTVSFGTTVLLQSLAVTNLGYSSSFTYDTSGSGELTSATYPYGGKMRWAYRGFTYTGSRILREVQNRYLTKAVGATETTYPFTRNDAADASKTLHSGVTLDDPSGIGEKAWTFSTTGAAWQLGLTTRFEDRPSAAQASQPLQRQDFTWVQDAVGNPYIGTVLTTLEPAGANVQTKTTQTLDTHGNVTQTNIFNYGNLTTPARTYNNTYVTDANYTSRYIFNRLLTTTVTGLSANLVSNTYDVGALSNVTGQREHDSANYGTGFTYRGNVTATTPVGSPTITYTRDITGNAVSATNSLGYTVATSFQNNYAAPSVITPNSNSNLQTSAAYTTWLALSSITLPNTATSSTSYDTFGRPYQSTSVHGAVTTYAYSGGTLPMTITATTNSHWVQSTLDGFGRATTVARGYNDGSGAHTVSTVNTVYGSCACSPLGKMTQVSQPYAPGGTQYWTTYSYDGLGRTVSVVASDGASTTTYSYSGNITTLTDPATKWKKQTVDVFGNIKQVNEPNPASGADYVTTYTYDLLNHLTQVSMPRPTGTQTRTFAYDPTTQRLMSETQPETGTTSYGYNPDGTLASKTNARNQVTKYTYDSYQRVTAIQKYPNPSQPNTADACQGVSYTYDTATGSVNAWGRVAKVQFGDPNLACSSMNFHSFTYVYGYTYGGLMTGKSLQVAGLTSGNLGAGYTYNNEGMVASVSPPWAANDTPRTYTYAFDLMGRPISLVDNQSPPFAWVQGVTYGPADELRQLGGFGGETRTYNSLLQMTRLTVSGGPDVEYNYSATLNNGRIVQSIDHTTGETMTYGYDTLNRLNSANASASTLSAAWGSSYGYDGFGNLTNKTPTLGSAPSMAITPDPATNRHTTAPGSYDATGNFIFASGQFSAGYDVANRLVTYSPTSGGSESYAYDPENLRVWKKNASNQEFFYFYGAQGERLGIFKLAASVTAVQRSVYFGRKLVTNFAPGPSNYTARFQDRLGSARDMPLNSGYYPYGEEHGSAMPTETERFATYFRDNISGWDYARNRYYSNTLGRFMSADPYINSAGLGDPGSWNRYTYVGGDPANFSDPSGADRGIATNGTCRVPGTGGSEDNPAQFVDCINITIIFSPSPHNGPLDAARVYKVPGHRITVTDPAGSRLVNRTITDLASELGNDPDCASWLSYSDDVRMAGGLAPYLDHLKSVAGAADISDPGVAALSNTYYVPGFSVLFNSEGGFFEGHSSIDMPTSSRDLASTRFNSDRGREFFLLHELGHLLGVPGFQQGDSDSTDLQRQNNDLIWTNCKKTLSSFSNVSKRPY